MIFRFFKGFSNAVNLYADSITRIIRTSSPSFDYFTDFFKNIHYAHIINPNHFTHSSHYSCPRVYPDYSVKLYAPRRPIRVKKSKKTARLAKKICNRRRVDL